MRRRNEPYVLIADYNAALELLPKLGEHGQKESAHLDRLNKIRSFSYFINTESNLLVKFGFLPGFCIQQAYNSANKGPVAKAAEALLTKQSTPLLLQHPSYRSDYIIHPVKPKTLEGHLGEVHYTGITSDGKRAVSGSPHNGIRVWDLEGGQCLRTIKADWITSLGITPDGKKAISGSLDGTVRVWELQSGHCLISLKRHSKEVTGIFITPDGEKAVSGSKDKTLRIWDLTSRECIKNHKGLSPFGDKPEYHAGL